jgi:hypothetical protein
MIEVPIAELLDYQEWMTGVHEHYHCACAPFAVISGPNSLRRIQGSLEVETTVASHRELHAYIAHEQDDGCPERR